MVSLGVLELPVAIAFELIRSEPPPRAHPTVWFGRLISFLDKRLPRNAYAGILPPLLTASLAIALSLIPSALPWPLDLLLSGYLLYCSISIRSMVEHALACLAGGAVVRERVRLIVSRDLDGLEDWQVVSAVIESVSENFVDGVLAPLLYYAIFGLPGALVYRAINTCDAMLGYRNERYREFGRVSARLDDLLNLIPSRLSLLLYAILSRRAFSCGLRSPKLNGHSISAMAGLLGVRLEKPGSYRIECGREPEVGDIERCVRYFTALSGMAVILALSLRLLV
ncbi:MAG: cobalamin biosynthesis protein CobD [Archaeoglobi archaeon]|nr:cobalamin biosynthesis protein CobD [Archaeoglobi archaeon]